MRLARVITRALVGISAPEVTVEVHIASGLPALSIVGLPEAAVRESKDRVRAAIQNSHFEFPMRRITVNLAPADLPKEGGRYDLPIALGILAASGQIKTDMLESHEFHGELALSGHLRAVGGSLPAALGAQLSRRKLVLPFINANEAVLVENVEVKAAKTLLEICQYLQQLGELHKPVAPASIHSSKDFTADMSEVRARYRQVDARQPPAGYSAADDGSACTGERGDQLDQSSWLRCQQLETAAVPPSASHCFRCRPGWRWFNSITGRNITGASRGAVSRRTHGI